MVYFRLGACPGCSESLLSAQVILFCHVLTDLLFLLYNSRKTSQTKNYCKKLPTKAEVEEEKEECQVVIQKRFSIKLSMQRELLAVID